MSEQSPTHPKERVLKVFEFLKAYTELKYPPVREISQQLRVLWLNNLPEHPSIEVFWGDRDTEDDSENADIFVRITRPDLTPCPIPPKAIADWLKVGWQHIEGKVEVHVSRNIRADDGQTILENFEEVKQRPLLLEKWRQDRLAWQNNERPARKAHEAFQTIYEWFGIHEREAERIEIIAADGLVNCHDDNGTFNHPVLFQKLEVEFYPEKHPPQFVFRTNTGKFFVETPHSFKGMNVM